MAVEIKGFASDWSVPAGAKDKLDAIYSPALVNGKQPVRKDELVINVRDYGAVPGTDCIAAFEAAVAAAPAGATVFIPPAPVGQRYLLSRTWIIDKQITVQGSVSRQKGDGGGVYGSVLAPTTGAAQSAMPALVQVVRHYVRVRDIGLVGANIGNGSIGLLFSGGAIGGWTPSDGLLGGVTASHGSRAEGVMSIQFGAGFSFGSDSDHIYLDNVVSSGNVDGLRIDGGNRFDFSVLNSELEGNTRSSVHLPPSANTENVTIVRTHMGFSDYGIYQEEPTTTGWGISGLTLLDSPIESVNVQHIRLVNGGNIRVLGGYWVWKVTPPANPAFHIQFVNKGAIWFHPKLEPNYPNAASPAVVSIPGYTNYAVYIDGALNGFASKWVNYGASVDISRIFVQGLPYGGQAKGAQGVLVTQPSSDQTIASVSPVYHGLFSIRAYVRVTGEASVTVKASYNDGVGVRTVLLADNVTLAPGNYYYSVPLLYAYTYNAIVVSARSSVATGVNVSAVITPEKGN